MRFPAAQPREQGAETAAARAMVSEPLPARVDRSMTASTGAVIEIGAAAGTQPAATFHAQVLDRNVDEHGLPHFGGKIEHEPVVEDHSVLSSQLMVGSHPPADRPKGAPKVDRERL